MKIVLLLLAALAGLSAGLQFPFSYEYQYTGEVKNGIHELRDQFAGSAIRASVKVSLVSSSEALVQIVNAEVGSINADVASSGRAPLPITLWKQLHDKQAMEQIFKIHFSGQQEKLQVPDGEILWISNVRKAIASLLRVPFVLSAPVTSYVDTQDNKIRSSSDMPKTFKKREQTLYGDCSVLYTLTKAAPRQTLFLKELSEDAQSPRVQIRPGQAQQSWRHGQSLRSNAAYRLYKSVDFHDCANNVVLDKASHGNMSMSGDGQVRGVQSRSSVGEYLLTGEPTEELSMRIEESIVEGFVAMNPFGHETKKLMSITNQTLSLLQATNTKLVDGPVGKLKDETWSYRVESPYKSDVDSPQWVSFQEEDALYPMYPEKDLTGFRLTDDLRTKLKSSIKNLLETVKRQVRQPNKVVESSFGGSLDGTVVQKLDSVASRMRALKKSDLLELFDIYVKQSTPTDPDERVARELFLSTLKASGSGASISVLVQKMREHIITDFESANIFVSMSSNLVNPTIMKDLIDHVKTLPEESSSISLKSSALINLSSMIRRICIEPDQQTFHIPREMMGTNKCSHDSVFGDFIPHLQNKLKSASKNWLRAIYIQALSNVGDISTVKTVSEVAQGVTLKDQKYLRILAIQGLSKNHMFNTSYQFANDVLMSVAEDQVENTEIREAAIASLFTLPQNATFWQRMALSTWREPSRRVSSFIYSTIKSLANSRDPHFIRKISMAKHVLPQAKPQPVSPYYSAYYMRSAYSTREDLAGTLQAMFLSSEDGIIPEQAALKLHSILGGMKIPLIHLSSSGKGDLQDLLQKLMDQLNNLPVTSQVGQNSNYRKSMDQFEKSVSGHRHLSSEDQKEMYAHLTVLKNMEIFSPITQDSKEQLSDPSKSMIASVVDKLMKKDLIQGLSYYNPVDITDVLPTDIGLPIITQISRPSFLYSEVVSQLTTIPPTSNTHDAISAKYQSVSGHAITKVVLKSEASMKVLVPWINQTIVTGVDGETTFSLPADFSVALDRRNPQDKIFQFDVSPRPLPSTTPVMMTRVLPFTLLRPLLSLNDISEAEVKPIHTKGDTPYYHGEIQVSKDSTGLDASIRFDGDVEFPVNSSTLMQTAIQPLRLIRLLVGPSTRQYQMSLLYRPEASPTKTITGTLRHTTVKDHKQPDDSPLTVVPDLSASDTMQQRLQKLSKTPADRFLSASLNLTGSQTPIKYEATLVIFPSKSQTKGSIQSKESRLQVNLMRSNDKKSPPNHQMCVSSTVQYPHLSATSTLSEILAGPLTTSILSHIITGETCSEQNKNMIVKGMQDVSVERRQLIKDLLRRGEDQHPFDTTEAVKSTTVYDKINAEVKIVKDLSPRLQNLTTFVSDTVHSLLFPHYIHNTVNVKGEQGLTIINGTRSVSADRYTIWTHSSQSICLVRDLKTWAIFDYVSPLNGYLYNPIPSSSGFKLEEPTSDTCIIEASRVKTLAGVRYQKSPMPCHQVAVKGDEGSDSFVILTKEADESSNTEQEVKIIYPKDALTIVMRPLEIMVNERRISEAQKEVKSEVVTTQTIAKVVQSSTEKIVEIPGRMSVHLSEGRVTIKLSQRFRSKVAGTCGRYSSSTTGDMRDSKGCLFSDQEGPFYAVAWVASSEYKQCKSSASSSLKQIFDDTEDYQRQCPEALHEQAQQRKPRHF